MTLSSEQRRALKLLAGGPRGYTEAMLAHGFKSKMLAGLVRDGLASMAPQRMHAGGRSVEVARLHITEAGRQALAGGA